MLNDYLLTVISNIGMISLIARMWLLLRTIRLADGPDAVHRRQVARAELKKCKKNVL